MIIIKQKIVVALSSNNHNGCPWVALLAERYLSNAASAVSYLFCRVKDHHKLLHDSSLSKKACFRRAALDKWFPLIPAVAFCLLRADGAS